MTVSIRYGTHLAKRRLADEYDAAQERGEVAKAGDPRPSTAEGPPTAANIGLTHKDIHEARQTDSNCHYAFTFSLCLMRREFQDLRGLRKIQGVWKSVGKITKALYKCIYSNALTRLYGSEGGT